MKRNYSPGKGCKCAARYQGECGCGADWTPTEVYRLRAELAEVKAKLAAAVAEFAKATAEFEDVRRHLEIKWDNAADWELLEDLFSGKGISPAPCSIPDKVMQLMERLAAAEAFVAKSAKTADGVPIHEGMHLFAASGRKTRSPIIAEMRCHGVTDDGPLNGQQWDDRADRYYSTPEAAKAAKEVKP